MVTGKSSHVVVRASRPHEHSENATPLSFRPSERGERAEESMGRMENPKSEINKPEGGVKRQGGAK